MQTEVLVVGAGPTGLMLASQLARRGIRPLVIDRHSGPAQQTRAMAVQARTLEIYAKLGIAGRALDLGRRANGASLWVRGRRAARIPMGEIGRTLSAFPYILLLGQDENERILGDRLRELGADVRWYTELVALDQRSDHVLATLKRADGTTRTVEAAYVAGCDGARSSVRELSGIRFPGAPYEHVFFVADTEAVGPMVPDELNVYLWRDGFHLFFPMRGKDRWRVIGILPADLAARDDLGFDDVVPAIRRESGSGVAFRASSWFSTYRIHHRCAERFRDDRCFLLGDAAHVHSPAGGQGMNTGLQDAYNLAWKLALVLRGQADECLLDTYEEERLPVARRLLRTTDRAFSFLVSGGWMAAFLRTRLLPRLVARAMQADRARALAFRTMSQTGVRYRRSALSETLAGVPDGAPRAGDRFPWMHLRFRADGPAEDLFERLDDMHFHLLAVGQEIPSALTERTAGRLRTHVVPDDSANAVALAAAHIAGPAFFLLRPDGHIGLAGTRIDPAVVMHHLEARGIHLDAQPPDSAAYPLHAA